MINADEFHNLIRVLHCLDGYEVEGIIDDCDIPSFCRNPIRYFLACSDETREGIWNAMQIRHDRGYRGARTEAVR